MLLHDTFSKINVYITFLLNYTLFFKFSNKQATANDTFNLFFLELSQAIFISRLNRNLIKWSFYSLENPRQKS